MRTVVFAIAAVIFEGDTVVDERQDVLAQYDAAMRLDGRTEEVGIGLATVFARYVSRILGTPVSFSERTMFEDEMLGIKYRNDIALESAVCQLFVDVCTAAKELLAA